MSDTPKVGETWMRSSLAGDREVKILEKVVHSSGAEAFIVSYYSEALGRRSCETVYGTQVYPKPVKVVSYQYVTATSCGHVWVRQSTTKLKDIVCCSKQPYPIGFIQRTEVTGDKIEVFVEKVL